MLSSPFPMSNKSISFHACQTSGVVPFLEWLWYARPTLGDDAWIESVTHLVMRASLLSFERGIPFWDALTAVEVRFGWKEEADFVRHSDLVPLITDHNAALTILGMQGVIQVW